MERRAFLGRLAALAGASAVAPHLWRTLVSDAAVVAGTGPYGALQAADANGIQLPVGFTSRLIGRTGQAVGATSYIWHLAPDGGACFPAAGGGWVYVSNSEVGASAGGASAVRFDASGAIVGAYRILGSTNANCAGGATPWGTWLSCEETSGTGRVYECDPQQAGQGVQRPMLGAFAHEAAAVDPVTGIVYLTEDDPAGRLYRFVPTTPGDLTAGTLQAASVSGTAVTWVTVSTSGPERSTATTAFNGGEGEWIADGRLWFTTKGDRRIWELDLVAQQLTILFDFATTPGSALNAVDNITAHAPSGDLFIAEDGGNMELCLIADSGGQDVVAPFLRFVGHSSSEVTGPAFSPDGTRLYVSSQRGTDGVTGVTYEITGPFRTASSEPTLVTVPISVDSYVRDGTYADLNYGTATTLQVCRATTVGANRTAYFELDTTGASGSVTRATLRLWSRGTSTTPVTLEVREVSAAWSESGITWNNRPAVGPVVSTFTLSSTTYGWNEIDITTLVAARRQANEPVMSFAVQPAASTYQLCYVASGESTSTQPAVRLELAVPPSTTTTSTTSTTASTTTSTVATTTTSTTTTSTTTPATPATLPISIDSYVQDGSSAGTNFGNATALKLERATTGGFNRIAYFRLDTSGAPGQVDLARLRLWCRNSAAGSQAVEVLAVSSTSWSETGITWNNRPSLGAVIGSFVLTSSTYGWYDVDITSYVQAERQAGRSAISFALRHAANSKLSYVASGEDSAHPPVLLINQ